MYEAAIAFARLLATFLNERLLGAGLLALVLVSGCHTTTTRTESMPSPPTPAEIQEKVHDIGDKVIIGTKDWFVIGNEKYKVFKLQVAQVTSTALVGKRIEVDNRISVKEGEVTVPFEQIETIEREKEVSAVNRYMANSFKCYFGLFPAIMLYPIPVPASEPAACSDARLPAPDPSDLP